MRRVGFLDLGAGPFSWGPVGGGVGGKSVVDLPRSMKCPTGVRHDETLKATRATDSILHARIAELAADVDRACGVLNRVVQRAAAHGQPQTVVDVGVCGERRAALASLRVREYSSDTLLFA